MFKLIIFVALMFSVPSIKGSCAGNNNTYAGYSVNNAKNALLRNKQHIDLLNYLLIKHGYTRYLEIGIADCQNLNQIIAPYKVGVDPGIYPGCPVANVRQMTSDQFFATNQETFDLIFIDGLHLCEQVLKDVENALKCLNPGGLIVMHDCMPALQEHQVRIFPGGAWNGDVWKAAAFIRMNLNNVHFCVLDMDYGCGVLTPNSSQVLFPARSIENMDWNFFVQNRNQLLNVISVENWVKSH